MLIKVEILAKLYYDEETSFGVFETEEISTGMVRNLVGKLPPVLVGETLEGEVTEERRFNKWLGKNEIQWKVKDSMLPSPPVNSNAMMSFLQDGFAWKVGPSIAASIVRTYGLNTLEVFKKMEENVNKFIDEQYSSVFPEESVGNLHPKDMNLEQRQALLHKLAMSKFSKKLFEPLTSVAGVGSKMAVSLLSGWIANNSKHELMLFLYSFGISTSMAVKVIKHLGNSAMNVLTDNPYKILPIIPNIPFKAPDGMAKKAGMDANDPRRLEALSVYSMNRIIYEGGHVCVPKKILLEKTISNSEKLSWKMNSDSLLKWSEFAVQSGTFVETEWRGKKYEYSPYFYNIETQTAEKILDLLRRPRLLPVDYKSVLKSVEKWEKDNGIYLDDSQRKAVETVIDNPMTLISGGPGTGKTTTMRCVRDVLREHGVSFGECAPTGKAARNMSPEAMTIHRKLGLNPANPSFGLAIEEDVLEIDESGMIDAELGLTLVKSIRNGESSSAFLGDVDQLQSVGPGSFFKSLIDSKKIPTIFLNTVHRTDKGGILDFLEYVRKYDKTDHSNSPLEEFGISREFSSDVSLCFPGIYKDGAGLKQEIISYVQAFVAHGVNPDNINVLAPMKKGEAGVYELNKELQVLLNSGTGKRSMEGFFNGDRILWKEGDKVMNVVNDYQKQIFNGEIGKIIHIDSANKTITVQWPFLDFKETAYSKNELDCLMHAWAVTIHKSQGSEYEKTIISMPSSSFIMAERALVYTAASRAKTQCVLLGDEKIYDKSVATFKGGRRCSLLTQRIACPETFNQREQRQR